MEIVKYWNLILAFCEYPEVQRASYEKIGKAKTTEMKVLNSTRKAAAEL